MSTRETATSATSPTPLLDLLLNFRAMLRLGREWLNVPNKHYTGFRFYDPTGKFFNIEKAGRFIHLYRQRRIEIHSWMRRRFIEDVLTPLKGYGAKWNIRRVKLDGHYVEIIEVTCRWYCILIALRNWCNPLAEREVSRIVRAFDKHARETYVEQQYKVVWKCIIAPAFEHGQAKMERYRNFLHFFRMSYVVNQGLLDGIARAAGTDYRYAYPSTGTWTTGAVDEVRGKLALFLGQEPTAAIDATEYNRMVDLVSRAHALRQHEPHPFCSGSNFTPTPSSSSSYIDPILQKASESSSSSLGGLDPPCVRKFPSPDPSASVLSSPFSERKASVPAVDAATLRYLEFMNRLAEKEEALRGMEESWNRRCKEVLDAMDREDSVRQTEHDTWAVRCQKFLDRLSREEAANMYQSESDFLHEARKIARRYDRINFIRRLLANNNALQGNEASVTEMIRHLWGLNLRTAREYCHTAYSMLQNSKETDMIRNGANTRRKRINHLYCMLITNHDVRNNPWKLIPYAMRTWGVGKRIAREYEQGAWTKFTHEKDFLEEDTTRSNMKTWLRPAYLCSLALDNPDLRKKPHKLIQHAMLLWGIQYRTAGRIVSRVEAMLRSELQ